MIDFILRELRRQPGVTIPDQAGTAALVAACQEYGGERLYVPKLPKLQSAVRLAQVGLAAGSTQEQLALATGLATRTVRRLQRGR